MLVICSWCARRDKQTAETAVYLFAVSSPWQANRRKSRLSIHGKLAVTSKAPKKPLIYYRGSRRDKQNAGKAVYLFTVSSPRQANRRKSRLSVRGGLAVTSKLPKQPFICSRWACRDKQTAEKAVYLFTVSLP